MLDGSMYNSYFYINSQLLFLLTIVECIIILPADN